MTVDPLELANTRLAALHASPAAGAPYWFAPLDDTMQVSKTDDVVFRWAVVGPPVLAAGTVLAPGSEVSVTLNLVAGTAVRQERLGRDHTVVREFRRFGPFPGEGFTGRVPVEASTATEGEVVFNLWQGRDWQANWLGEEEGAVLGGFLKDQLMSMPPDVVLFDLGSEQAQKITQPAAPGVGPVSVGPLFAVTKPGGTVKLTVSGGQGQDVTWRTVGEGSGARVEAAGRSALYTAGSGDQERFLRSHVVQASVGGTAADAQIATRQGNEVAEVVNAKGAEDQELFLMPGGSVGLALRYWDGEGALHPVEGSDVRWDLVRGAGGTFDDATGVYTAPAELTAPDVAVIEGTVLVAGILAFSGYRVIPLFPPLHTD